MLCQGPNHAVLHVLLLLCLISINSAIAEPDRSDDVVFSTAPVYAFPGDTVTVPFFIDSEYEFTGYFAFVFAPESAINPLWPDLSGTMCEGWPTTAFGHNRWDFYFMVAFVLFDDALTLPPGYRKVCNLVMKTDASVEEGSLLPLTLCHNGQYVSHIGEPQRTKIAGFHSSYVFFKLNWDDISGMDFGDLNLNQINFEIADLITLQNQIISGASEVSPYYHLMKVASDVDFDHLPWTVSDMLTMKAVILGEMAPLYPNQPQGLNNSAGDSLWFTVSAAVQPDTIEIPLYMSNVDSAAALTVSFDYSHSDLDFLELNLDGTRLPADWDAIQASERAEGLIITAWKDDFTTTHTSPLPPGSGLIGVLKFAVLNPTVEELDFHLTPLQNRGRMNGYALWENDRWRFASLQNKIQVIEFDFIRGDLDDSGGIDIDDIVFLIEYVFSGGPAPDPLTRGDFNGDSEIDSEDVIALIAFIFG